MGTSRGDGITGEVITENLKTIKDIPQKISSKDFPKDIDIRGEVFIKKKDYKGFDILYCLGLLVLHTSLRTDYTQKKEKA